MSLFTESCSVKRESNLREIDSLLAKETKRRQNRPEGNQMKATVVIIIALALLATGCSTPMEPSGNAKAGTAPPPAQQTKEEKARAAAERKQKEEQAKREKEEQRVREKYSGMSTDDLLIKVESLTSEINTPLIGWGWGLAIAAGIRDGKIKERAEILGEVSRRRGNFEPGRRTTRSTGSGFFISGDGYFITSRHVVAGATNLQVRTSSGAVFAAKILRTDEANDLAVLKVDGTFKPLPILSSREAKLGQAVFTVGFPFSSVQGVEPKLNRGDISSLFGLRDDPTQFQISVAVQPGNSGGPLIDLKGNVIGIIASRLRDSFAYQNTGAIPQNVNYAVKSSLLIVLLESFPGIKLPPTETSDTPFESTVARAIESIGLVTAE